MATESRLIDFLDRGCLLDPDRACLVEDEMQWSYGDVVRLSHRLAGGIRARGVASGESVAIYAPNCAAGYLAMLGIFRAECVLVPANARHSAEENIRHMRLANTRLLFLDSRFAHLAARLRSALPQLIEIVLLESAAEQAAAFAAFIEGVPAHFEPDPPCDDIPYRISCTGGTTGAPKLVVQTHRSIVANVLSFMVLTRYDAPPRYLLAAPMTHAGGVASYFILALGGTIFFPSSPKAPALISAIARFRIDTLLLPPTAIYALLDAPELVDADCSSLRYFMFAAAPIHPVRLQASIDRFGAVMMQLYGQTEASMVLLAMRPEDYRLAAATPGLAHRMESAGRPGPLARVAIMNEQGGWCGPGETGELVVRSPMVMREYVDEPEETAASRRGGWHHTGDLAEYDEDGFFYLRDRKRDLIVSGGFNVFPAEVEAALAAHPAVSECAVVGMPDPYWGEAVVAVVVAKSGATIDPAALTIHCRDRLGPVKSPKRIDVVDALPRSALGKLLRREVRDRYWSDRVRNI